jgi:hypothetical protein
MPSQKNDPAQLVRLFEHVPELIADAAPDDRAFLLRYVVVEQITLGRGTHRLASHPAGPKGFFVLGGFAARRLAVGDRVAAELVGGGDVIAADGADASDGASAWEVIAPLRLAVLDGDVERLFLAGARARAACSRDRVCAEQPNDTPAAPRAESTT